MLFFREMNEYIIQKAKESTLLKKVLKSKEGDVRFLISLI